MSKEIKIYVFNKIKEGIKYFYVYYRNDNKFILHASNDLKLKAYEISELTLDHLRRYKNHKNIKAKRITVDIIEKQLFIINNNVWSLFPNLE